MYRKVMFSLMLLSLILLSLIAWKVGVFTAIVGLPFFPLVEKIVTNTYFSGVACSIIAVIIIYKWQVWYSKRKLKQDFRCNECIEGIYDGIEAVRKYMPLVPEKEKWDRVCDYEEFRKKNAKKYVDFYWEHKECASAGSKKQWPCDFSHGSCSKFEHRYGVSSMQCSMNG